MSANTKSPKDPRMEILNQRLSRPSCAYIPLTLVRIRKKAGNDFINQHTGSMVMLDVLILYLYTLVYSFKKAGNDFINQHTGSMVMLDVLILYLYTLVYSLPCRPLLLMGGG